MKIYVFEVTVDDSIPSAVTADDLRRRLNTARGVDAVRTVVGDAAETPPEPVVTGSPNPTAAIVGFLAAMREVDTPTLKRWAKNDLISALRRDVAAGILTERGESLL